MNVVEGSMTINGVTTRFLITEHGWNQGGDATTEQLGERVTFLDALEEALQREDFFSQDDDDEPTGVEYFASDPAPEEPDDKPIIIDDDDDEMPTVREEDRFEYLKSVGAI